jgi:cytosine/uracil/thiamine/allantoin permease
MHYWHGFNIRAVIAFVFGIVPTLPGFVRAVGGTSYGIPIGASYLYSCVWPVGFSIAAITYYLGNVLFPYRYHRLENSVIERSREDSLEGGAESADEKK